MVYSKNFLLSEQVQRRTVPWLEFFHPYKHACEVLWKHESFLYGFFAPLHHHIYPTTTVPDKPPLKILECIFTLLRLVYPSVRDKLEEAIGNADRKNRNALGNVQLLFDFFLPVVILTLISPSLDRFRITDLQCERDLLLRSGQASKSCLPSSPFSKPPSTQKRWAFRCFFGRITKKSSTLSYRFLTIVPHLLSLRTSSCL